MRHFSSSQIEELDELTYKRFRSETNQSQSYSPGDAQRLRTLISELWKVPRARPGDLVAGVVLEEVVGKGAFGTVWKGRTLAENQLRAVKIFDADRLGDGLAVHLFRRGVRAMLYLREQSEREQRQSESTLVLSEFIVKIREVEPHMLAFSMDWIPDGELSSAAISGQTLEAKISCFRHIAKAVHYAHTRPQPIVHRDIKPQNIVMNGDTPILTDFDIADMAFARTLSRRGVGGAFAYAAPEQLSGECEQLEKRSDVYSLGRLLHFFLLEGDPPLQIERNPPLEELNAFPEGLVKIIRRCTHREPEMRYADVNELLEELARYEQADQVGAFGPNAVLGRLHWQLAEEHATRRQWEQALKEAEQALGYMQGLEPELVEKWTLRVLLWRLRRGEWRLFWSWSSIRLQQLSLPSILLLLFLVMVPLLLPLAEFERSRARRDKFEQAIRSLVQSPSLESNGSQLSLAMLKESPQSLKLAQKRLVEFLSRSRGRQACRLLRLVNALAPRSPQFLFLSPVLTGKKVQSYHERRVSRLLGLHSQFRWGPIDCPQGVKLPWMRLTPKKKLRRCIEWKAQKADLRFLHAEGVVFAKADLTGSNLSMSTLKGSHLTDAGLSSTNFMMADLQKMLLVRSNLMGAVFSFADLRGSNLDHVQANYVDFRFARMKKVNFQYGTYTGAIFDADSLPALREGQMHPQSFQRAICLSGGPFLLPGAADRCFHWHRNRHMNRGMSRVPRPAFCPNSLSLHTIFIAYPPGRLKKEGQCPPSLRP